MGAPAITGLNAITRSAGSFLTGGWRIGQRLLLQDATTVDNDALARITAAAAANTALEITAFGGDY